MHNNYFDKSVKFLEFEESTKSGFMTTRQVNMSLRQNAQVFMVFVCLRGGSERMITNIHVVCEFPEVFQDDFCDLPLKHEVEFSIGLVLGTNHVLIAPYMLSTS